MKVANLATVMFVNHKASLHPISMRLFESLVDLYTCNYAICLLLLRSTCGTKVRHGKVTQIQSIYIIKEIRAWRKNK